MIHVYYVANHTRSTIIGRAMYAGIKACGEQVELREAARYRAPESDVAVFYGMVSGLGRLLTDYPEAGKKALFADLGYWGRRKKTRWDGYHKLTINSRHPTAYFQKRKMPNDRFAATGVQIEPWRKNGHHIIVAGMSAKASWASGFAPEQWERETIATLRKLTKRPIIYRPKPNWLAARPIIGSIFQTGIALEDTMKDCHAIVSHHSNVAIEGLCIGIPAFVVEGASLPMASTDLAMIESPRYPAGRAQWLADLAWTQWSLAEMQSGAAWRHFKREGLV